MTRNSVAAACALFVAGCGSGRVPVGGRITLDGVPKPDLLVDFCPADGTRPQGGVTDADGRYLVASHHHENGTPPGRYDVKIYPAAGGPPVLGRLTAETELTADVPRGGGTFDFALTGKSKKK